MDGFYFFKLVAMRNRCVSLTRTRFTQGVYRNRCFERKRKILSKTRGSLSETRGS
jgi:hypothetical protein